MIVIKNNFSKNLKDNYILFGIYFKILFNYFLKILIASKINLSLTMLGRCIEALAEKELKKGAKG